MDESFILYTDAGSRGNPGPAAAAAILFNHKEILVDLNALYLGLVTNNVAEYEALLLGLKLAIKHHVQNLHIVMDSQLVVKQIKGEYKVKDFNLKQKHISALDLMKEFKTVDIQHVYREKNVSADKLVNIILDAIQHGNNPS